jgi:hypothetical protein
MPENGRVRVCGDGARWLSTSGTREELAYGVDTEKCAA